MMAVAPREIKFDLTVDMSKFIAAMNQATEQLATLQRTYRLSTVRPPRPWTPVAWYSRTERAS